MIDAWRLGDLFARLGKCLRRNGENNFIILGNYCFLSGWVSKVTPGGKFSEEMGLREDELREKGFPDAQIINVVKIFFLFPIVKFV